MTVRKKMGIGLYVLGTIVMSVGSFLESTVTGLAVTGTMIVFAAVMVAGFWDEFE